MSKSLPILIDLSNGVSNEISHVSFPHILCRVPPCHLSFSQYVRSTAGNIPSWWQSLDCSYLQTWKVGSLTLLACRGFMEIWCLSWLRLYCLVSSGSGRPRECFWLTRGVRCRRDLVFLGYASVLGGHRVAKPLTDGLNIFWVGWP